MRNATRPWPAPRWPWVLSMTWRHLLFLHWPVPSDILAGHVPGPLELDTFHGQAWLGLTSFLMTAVRPRLAPPLPGLSRFEELNLRTYVTVGGRPGVWFFSLDAAHPIAVRTARVLLGLPYRDARMSLKTDSGRVAFRSERTERRWPPASLEVEYGPTGPVAPSRPGSLEHWLTERYCLYTVLGGGVWRLEIDHAPWPLQPAAARIQSNTVAAPLGIALAAGQELAHYSRELRVRAWLPGRVAGKGVRTPGPSG